MHTQEEQAPPTPAALVRVTPQELASALARLEARQEAGKRHRDGTVALGEVVQELGLPVTPEELWREVQVGRTQAQAAPRRASRARVLQAGAVFAVALALTWGGIAFLRSPPQPSAAPIAVAAPAPTPAAPIAIPVGLLVRDASGRMVLLSEVADGRPVLCGLAATDRGAAFAPFAPDSLHWTLIKHGGRVYLRGWIADMSPAALRSSPVEIHPVRAYVASGLHPVPVTLPVDGFASTLGLTNDDTISASGVKPDEHFGEKW